MRVARSVDRRENITGVSRMPAKVPRERESTALDFLHAATQPPAGQTNDNEDKKNRGTKSATRIATGE